MTFETLSVKNISRCDPAAWTPICFHRFAGKSQALIEAGRLGSYMPPSLVRACVPKKNGVSAFAVLFSQSRIHLKKLMFW